MTTKLTLSIDKEIIKKAKYYAKRRHRSLSEIITQYLDNLTDEQENQPEIDDDVLDLADEIPFAALSDIQEVKFRYLKDKYLHK